MSLNYRTPAMLAALLAMTSQTVLADLVKSSPAEIRQELQYFEKDTKTYMTRRGMRHKGGSRRQVQQRATFEGRQGYRAYIQGYGATLRDALKVAKQKRSREEAKKVKEEFGPYNQANRLVEVTDANLASIDKKWTEGKVAVAPWSDTYWPIYAGVTSVRYAHENGNYVSGNWRDNRDYVYKNSCNPDDLSPAEKYDALMGIGLDSQYSLAREQAEEGSPYADPETGEGVETWMGICHGWAPAAYMQARPQKAVVVKAANGASLRFYPSDIKGLTSLLWANANIPDQGWTGRRCEDKNPQTDQIGRVQNGDCRDVNPGTWHLALTNEVGGKKRSFVLDATYSYEVWNQPIKSYSYTYFNPATQQVVEMTTADGKPNPNRLKQAAAPIGFSGDKFAQYRSSGAKYVVGVNMDLEYVVETNPTHAMTDSEEEDSTRTVSFMYDLELDAKGNIVGGEWYENDHPDFLWTPRAGQKAYSSAEKPLVGSSEVVSWDPRKLPVPSTLRKLAPNHNQRGKPLGLVVEKLIEASNK
jgi:hypothetical protein